MSTNYTNKLDAAGNQHRKAKFEKQLGHDDALALRDLLLKREYVTDEIAPNLIGVGAARCGTTTLYHLLSAQNDVFMSPVKELRYFSHKAEEIHTTGMTWRDYLLFFLGAHEHLYRGEISPHYLHSPVAPELIKQKCPNAKIFIQLRHPFDRFVSHFYHHQYAHRYNSIKAYFSDARAAIREGRYPKKWHHPRYSLEQSFYYCALTKYYDTFHHDQIAVIGLKEFKKDPVQVCAQLTAFLDCEIQPVNVGKKNEGQHSEKDDDRLDAALQAAFMDLTMADLEKTEKFLNIKLDSNIIS